MVAIPAEFAFAFEAQTQEPAPDLHWLTVCVFTSMENTHHSSYGWSGHFRKPAPFSISKKATSLSPWMTRTSACDVAMVPVSASGAFVPQAFGLWDFQYRQV